MSHRPPLVRPERAFSGPLLEAGGLWLLVLLAGVLLIAALFNHLRQHELQTLERAQLELTLLDIKGELEGDLSVGMDLHDDPRIQPLLESHLEKDAQLYSLELLSEDGRALFSTDRGIVGEPLPPAVLATAQQAAAQQQAWHAQIGATPVMGVVLRGPFGEVAGHVSASYASRAAGHAMDRAMTLSVAMALLATVLAGSAAVWLATRSQRQLLRQQSRHPPAPQVHAARQRLDDGSARLDAVERIE